MKFLISLIALNLFSIGPYFDGQFYPKDKLEIEKILSKQFFLAKNQTKNINKNNVKAVISPHAGYIYSSRIAAISYSMISDSTELFIIISPSHKHLINGAAVTKEKFNTPLGTIETDTDFVNILLKNRLFEYNSKFFEMEHAIEVQLPFIIYKFKKAKIVPILVNTYDLSKLSKIAEEIKKAMDITQKKSIIIVSSDFSHYPDNETAKKADLSAIESIKMMDENYFDLYNKITISKNIKNLDTIACGSSAIITAIKLSKLLGANKFIDIELSNSYEETKSVSKENVVGYLSGVFIYDEKGNKTSEEKLTQKEKKELLDTARNSINEYLNGNTEIIKPEIHSNPKFNVPQAVFVTLYKKGYLRGCIGTTEPRAGLLDAVKYFGVQSAFNDSRFSPITKEELKDIKIEISLLSPLKETKSYKEIKEKKDGVVIITKSGSGLFLPQVWDYFKTKEEFLSELCQQKAGVESECWKNKDTKIYTFNVEIIEE